MISQTAEFQVADYERCGGILKPDVVYFGETVPKERVERYYALVGSSSALVVAGSSLTIQRGRRFARHAVKAGKPVAIINRGETYPYDIAAIIWDIETKEALGVLAEGLGRKVCSTERKTTGSRLSGGSAPLHNHQGAVAVTGTWSVAPQKHSGWSSGWRY